jgi:hypothetical protein
MMSCSSAAAEAKRGAEPVVAHVFEAEDLRKAVAAASRASCRMAAAAQAAALATTRGDPGVYNIAEDDGAVSSEKAKRQLDWSSAWRLPETRSSSPG